VPSIAANVLMALRRLSEFDQGDLASSFSGSGRAELRDYVRLTLDRAEVANDEYAQLILVLLYTIYESCEDLRAGVRGDIIRFLNGFSRSGRQLRHAQVRPVLELLGQIVAGMNPVPLESEASAKDSQKISQLKILLQRTLLGLHATNEMTLWRDQVPVLSLFHADLVYCVLAVLDQIALHELQFQGSRPLPQEAIACQAEAIQRLLDHWPDRFMSNTPKQVLLLHELERLLTHALPERSGGANCENDLPQSVLEVFARVRDRVVSHLCSVLKGDNFRPLERVLLMWTNPRFARLLQHPGHSSAVILPLLEALVRPETDRAIATTGTVGHWNPTVNRMTKLVLSKLLEADRHAFTRAANELFSGCSTQLPGGKTAGVGSSSTLPASEGATRNASRGRLPTAFAVEETGCKTRDEIADTTLSLAGRRAIRPATGMAHAIRTGGKQPPVTITGVAPWAFSPATRLGLKRGQAAPGVASIGEASVAPADALQPDQQHGRTPPGRRVPAPRSMEGLREERRQEVPGHRKQETEDPDRCKTATVTVTKPSAGEQATATREVEVCGPTESITADESELGLQYVLCYMERLSAEHEEVNGQAWHSASMAPAPVLLPALKFHDLIWGKELGYGAFSRVRYARRVIRGGDLSRQGRSTWPEYAVKCIDGEKVREEGLQLNVSREIAVLRMLTHPGIARLVSSFAYKGDAYLVLEFASLGDLQSLISRLGALPQRICRFVSGSVAAAVLHIHDLGFVYGDLKPENILLTQTGHVKITDFGACQPFSVDALQRLKERILESRRLRSGDWRDELDAPGGVDSHASDLAAFRVSGQGNSQEDLRQEDLKGEDLGHEGLFKLLFTDRRVEGTVAYLAPEIVKGSSTSTLGDAYSLGCVLYRLLMGKPPQWGVEMEEVAERQVRFAERSEDDKYPQRIFSANTRSACSGLLRADPSQRLGIEAFAHHEFFAEASEYNDVFTLHQLDSSGTPDFVSLCESAAGMSEGDAEWNQRTFSRIWAPLPTKFEFMNDHAALMDENGPSESSGVRLQNGFRLRNTRLVEAGLGAIPERSERGRPFGGLLPDSKGSEGVARGDSM